MHALALLSYSCKDFILCCQTPSVYLLVHFGFLIRIIAKGSYNVNHSGTACVRPEGTALWRVDF